MSNLIQITTSVILLPMLLACPNKKSKQSEQSRVCFSCDRQIFSSYTQSIEPKFTDKQEERGYGTPQHCKYLFHYYHPTWKDDQYAPKWLKIIPLTDVSVSSFKKSYNALFNTTQQVRKILQQRPKSFPLREEAPVWEYTDVGQTIHSKITYIDTNWQSGFYFINHGNVDTPSKPVNNSELELIYQGISHDNKYFVIAWFCLFHPKLPTSSAEIDVIPIDEKEAHTISAENLINSLPDSEFSPPINKIREMLISIHSE